MNRFTPHFPNYFTQSDNKEDGNMDQDMNTQEDGTINTNWITVLQK